MPSDGETQEQPVLFPPSESQENLHAAAKRTGRASSSGRYSKQTRANVSTKEPADPGAELERRVARLEFAEGALVRMRLPVFSAAEAGRGIITDLDVVSVDVDLRLRMQLSILECKSGKGQSGEPDRLLWLSGLRTYVRAQRASLVRQTVSTRGRAIAARLNINVMDVPTLEKREAAHAWLPERFGHVGGHECAAAESSLDDYVKSSGELPPPLISALRNDGWVADPHIILGTVTALGRYAESLSSIPAGAGIALSGHALNALVLAALKHSHEYSQLSSDEFKARLETAMSTGSPFGGRIQSTLAIADQLYDRLTERIHEAYVRAGALRQTIDLPAVSELAVAVPPWISQYMDFLEALALNPSVGRDLLQTIDLTCFDALLGGEAYLERAFDGLFTPEHRQLLRLAARTLSSIGGEQVARPLLDLETVKFDRSAPSITERRAPSAKHQ